MRQPRISAHPSAPPFEPAKVAPAPKPASAAGDAGRIIVADASKATFPWEMPYWNEPTMPHNKGNNVVHADGSAWWYRGDAAQYDWWAFHSWEGWE